MTATLIDGGAIAAALRDDIADPGATPPVPPGSSTVLVGNDPASVAEVARVMTPVPGGMGPTTVATLQRTIVLAARDLGSDRVVGA